MTLSFVWFLLVVAPAAIAAVVAASIRRHDGEVANAPLVDLRVSEDAPDAQLAAYCQVRNQEDQARAEQQAETDRAQETAKAEAEVRQLERVERLVAGELTPSALAAESARVVDYGRMPLPPSRYGGATGVGGTMAVMGMTSASSWPRHPVREIDLFDAEHLRF